MRNVVARFLRTGGVQVAVAGRFLAWSWDWNRSKRPDLHGAKLTVYDHVRQRVAYAVDVPRSPRIAGIYSIDVQSDGTVAAQLVREIRTCFLSQLVWSAPSPAPRLRVLPDRAELGWSTDLELAGDRLMFLRSLEPRCSATSSAELVVRQFGSSDVRILGRYGRRTRTYPGPSFDFDGARYLYSEVADSRNKRVGTAIFVADAR